MMGDETSDTMNLDLNLSPGPEGGSRPIVSEPGNVDDWDRERFRVIAEEVRLRGMEELRLRARQRWRWRHVQIPPETQNISMELNPLTVNSGNGSTLQAGEGSVAAEERTTEVPKLCENNNGFIGQDASEKTDDVEKGSGIDGGFFDCNICLDLARDPVVTCCGHLFCWPCLYQWLHLHSDAKECPVCKGEVTIKNVTPIYGRGNNTREPEEDSSVKIPLRPHARRVESLRQTIRRTPHGFPVEEMLRRIGSRFELTRDLVQQQEFESAPEGPGRFDSLLNRWFLTAQAIRREQNPVPPPEDVIDLTQNSTTIPEVGESRRLQSLLLRRSQSHRAATISLSSALNSSEGLVESYLHSNPTGRNQEQEQPPLPVDDRDSFSSIVAVINSESQTVDTAVEIDSMVSLSTSSSRRRNDVSRVSDVDSEDSREPRRRRLN